MFFAKSGINPVRYFLTLGIRGNFLILDKSKFNFNNHIINGTKEE
jgi:hypothetical protein